VKKLLVSLFVVLALVTAACGDDDAESGDADTDTETTEPPTTEPETTGPPTNETETTEPPTTEPEPEPLTASFRGVTETEIQIGIGINDATEFGVDGGDKQTKWQVVIDEVNENGGVLGRTLVPQYQVYPSTGATEQEAACVAHTEDEPKVFAFIGEARQNNELCYTELHDTLAINTFASTEDVIAASKGLLFSSTQSALGVEVQAVRAAGDAGLLEGQGVFVHARAETADLIPPIRAALEDEGATVLGDLVPNAPQGDRTAIQAEADAQIERVKVDGATTVFSISDAGLTMAGAAQRTGSDVTILTTFASGDIYITLGYDPATVDLHVFAPEPLSERYAAGEPGLEECVTRFEEASGEIVNIGVPDPVPDNFGPTINSCKAIDMFVQIATAAGTDLTNDTFTAAAAGIGEFDLVGASAASLGPDKIAADDTALVPLEWDPVNQVFVSP
jgi:hypothetical protein